MRLQFASDLHLEARPKQTFETILEAGLCPNLALLGDIAPVDHPNFRPFLEWCSERWTTILFVPGATELGNPSRPEDLELALFKLRSVCAPFQNIHVLQRGDTFFTDDGLLVLGLIYWSHRPWVPIFQQEEHTRDMDWIRKTCKQYTNPVLILSHMGPTAWVQEEVPSEPDAAGVFPEVELILRSPLVAWVFGHCHATLEYAKTWNDAGGTGRPVLMLCNGLGTRKTPNPDFRADAILRLDPAVFYRDSVAAQQLQQLHR